jgi:hypothetical protein
MSHHVLAIFLTAAYFSHRSSIFVYLVPVEPPRLKIPKSEFDVQRDRLWLFTLTLP